MPRRKKGGTRSTKARKATPRPRSKGFDLVLAGVGGQGILLAGRVICQAAIDEGNGVNAFESHGMAQRGGAVVNHIRWGPGAHSPLILEGRADMLVALEPVEALRHLPLVGKGTVVVLNTKTIPPITVSSVPGARYPSVKEAVKALKPHVGRVVVVDGTAAAEALGNPAFISTVMVGAAWGTGALKLRKQTLRSAIEGLVPPRFKKENLEAFDEGARLGRGRRRR